MVENNTDTDDRIGRSSFAQDALYIDSDTTPEEVKDFLRQRVENPIKIESEGVTVWNFSAHDVDIEALEYAAKNVLREKTFVIPFQVTGTWGAMFSLLPKELKEAEVLIYKPSEQKYFAYRNFYAEIPEEVQDEFRYQLSQLSSSE
jgi:hypothetical protein